MNRVFGIFDPKLEQNDRHTVPVRMGHSLVESSKNSIQYAQKTYDMGHVLFYRESGRTDRVHVRLYVYYGGRWVAIQVIADVCILTLKIGPDRVLERGPRSQH